MVYILFEFVKKNNFIMYKFSIAILLSTQLLYGESAAGMQNSANNSKILQYANSFIGRSYEYGKKSDTKIDCSGYVQEVYNHFGIELPRNVIAQSRIGKRIDLKNIQKGDLLFFYRTQKFIPSHVAIYAGDGKIIHASYMAKCVHIDSFNKPFYKEHFLYAKRVSKENDRENEVKYCTFPIPPPKIMRTLEDRTSLPMKFRNYQIFDGRDIIISEEGAGHLRKWAKLFKLRGDKALVTINVYTDNIPPNVIKERFSTNLILSEARAKVIAEFLINQGINPSNIKAYGLGDIRPVASNETKEGQSKNRRIEFIFK